MKRFFLVLAATVGALASTAQIHVNANIAGQFEVEGGMRAGVDVEIPLRNKLSVVPGAYWSQRRYSETSTNKNYTVTYKDRADYLTVPVLLGIRLGDDDKKVVPRVLVGPYVACGLGGHTDWTRDEEGIITSGKVDAFGSDDSAWHTRFDAGVHAGFDLYIAKHLVVGAYTELGFVRSHHMHNTAGEIVSQIFLGVGNRNYSAGLSVGYRF